MELKNLRVMILLSEETVANQIEKEIRAHGIDRISIFLSVPNALSFLRLATKTKDGFPHVAIVGMIMAPYSGYSFLEFCFQEKNPCFQTLKIVLLVPDPSPSLVSEALSLGAFNVMTLPFKFDHFAKCLEES